MKLHSPTKSSTPPAPVLPSSLNFLSASHHSTLSQLLRHMQRSKTDLQVSDASKLDSRLHAVYLIRWTNGAEAVLKIPGQEPYPSLSIERDALRNEMRTLGILADRRHCGSFMFPSVITSSSASSSPASKAKSQPLLRTYIPGETLSSQLPILSQDQISQINDDLGSLVARLSLYSPPHQTHRFGSVAQVLSVQGFKTWHDAFLSMMDSTLRDAEDVLVSLPYGAINEQIARFASSLDSFNTPRLLLPNLIDGASVILNHGIEGKHEQTVKGVADVSAAIWGDIGFTDLWNDEDTREDAWEGFKQALSDSDEPQTSEEIEELRQQMFEGDGARRQLL